MASFRVLVQPPGAGLPLRADTETMDIDFKSISVGEDKLKIDQEGTDLLARLRTTARLAVADAVNSDEAITKGQLDAVPRLKVEYHSITNDDIDAGGFDLTQTPVYPEEVVVDLIGGVAQAYTDDFTVTGKFLSLKPQLSAVLNVNDKIRLQYLHLPT